MRLSEVEQQRLKIFGSNYFRFFLLICVVFCISHLISIQIWLEPVLQKQLLESCSADFLESVSRQLGVVRRTGLIWSIMFVFVAGLALWQSTLIRRWSRKAPSQVEDLE